MGRITLFVSEDCKHCLRAKHALKERSIPFEEISIVDYPERRKDMLSLSDQLTVPQIFFNEKHIGGANDLFTVLECWDKILPSSSSPSPSSSSSSSSSANDSVSTTTPALDMYRTEIKLKPDPIDERLALPIMTSSLSSADDETNTNQTVNQQQQQQATTIQQLFGCFLLPDGSTSSILELTKNLVKIMPRYDKLPYKNSGTYYRNSFPGTEGIDAIMKHYFPPSSTNDSKTQTRNSAIIFGLALQQYGIIHHVTSTTGASRNNKDHQQQQQQHLFSDTDSELFRLQPFHEPHILNSFLRPQQAWNTNNGTIDNSNTTNDDDVRDNNKPPPTTGQLKLKNPIILINHLQSIISGIISRNTNSNGMDYVTAKMKDPGFYELEEASCAVQCIDMTTLLPMKEEEENNNNDQQQQQKQQNIMMAFFINLYNVMIQHAFLKVGIPSETTQRKDFYNGICYNVGGYILSLDDVEHGILRGNIRHPYQFTAPFSSSDERKILSLSKLDPRIHFTLNCGANSCPPISRYTPNALEEELRIAAMSFCEDDTNVLINEDKMEVSLSMILKWYKSDFVSTSMTSSSKLPQVIVTFLREESTKQVTLQRMIHSKVPIKIKYLSYDWGTNASQSVTFNSQALIGSQTSLITTALTKLFFSSSSSSSSSSSKEQQQQVPAAATSYDQQSQQEKQASEWISKSLQLGRQRQFESASS